MKNFNCPSCGAEVVFQSHVSVYAVCAFCSSMIVRHDIDVEAIGTMAALPDDMSPLMIGTEGVFQGQRFYIIGRLKIGWQDGTWNEWYMMAENGGRGWVAEAQGFYAVCFETDEALPSDTAKTISRFLKDDNAQQGNDRAFDARIASLRGALLGTYLFLNQLKYKVVDVKVATCIGCEGELPFMVSKGRKTLAIDLLGHHGEFGSIEIAQDKTRIYLGHYVDWNDLHCQNLRLLEDW
jgi:Domain of unknown function (DUF4178)